MKNLCITPWYFDKYNILYQNKFGFRQGHSSPQALITLVNKITQSLDSGDMVMELVLFVERESSSQNRH